MARSVALVVFLLGLLSFQLYLLWDQSAHPTPLPDPHHAPPSRLSPSVAVAVRPPDPPPAVPPPKPDPNAIPQGQLYIPPTATPDPAHILRAYVDDGSLRPHHFEAPTGLEVWIMVKNLGHVNHTVSLQAGDKPPAVEIKPAEEGRFSFTLKPGRYRVTVPDGRGDDFAAELVVQ